MDIALITGGSRGLGLEIAKELILQKKIGKVIILDIISPEFQFIDKDLSKIEYHKCDVGNRRELQFVIEKVIENLNNQKKNISICINNAGIRHNESLLSLSQEKIDSIFNVNTMSHILVLKAILKNHVEEVIPRELTNNNLFIVSVSSILGTLAPKNLSIYSASKAAIIQIHEALTQEVSHLPMIRLLLVTTGQLTTSMFGDVIPPMKFLAPVVNHIDLAKDVVCKIEKGEKGVLCAPLYANFLPIVKCLPIFMQDYCRWFSGIDTQIKENQ
jgi:NAD(P)-dependent dehydrogenase (short-subunit alcohol dehydrogenase family)